MFTACPLIGGYRLSPGLCASSRSNSVCTSPSSISLIAIQEPNFLVFSVVPHGFGRHVWVDPEDAKRSWAQGIFITGLSYTGAICCIKCSVLAFYWRIFKRSRIRVPIYIVTAIVLCRGISAVSQIARLGRIAVLLSSY